MKFTIVSPLSLAVLVVAAVVACKPKKEAVSTTETAKKTPLEYAVSRWPGTTEANLKQGEEVYTGKCQKCHKLFEIKQFDMKKWAHEIDDMAPKAKLTAEEKLALQKYIFSNVAINSSGKPQF